MDTTLQSEVGRLESVVLRHPRDAYVSQSEIDLGWKALGYTAPPDFGRALAEYDAFTELLEELGVELHFVAAGGNAALDSTYVRDASVVSDRGVVLCNMGKEARRQEPDRQRKIFDQLEIPILGRIEAPGTLEGGDVAWLDQRRLAIARSYRSNDEGILQLRHLLAADVDEFLVMQAPHWQGPEDVFHLMSVLSPIDRDLALVYSPLMSVQFREALLERGFTLVEVPDEEFGSLGCNCLAVGPRRSILPAGNPVTRGRLEAAGVEVFTLDCGEICLKGHGGPTCLTRPLDRDR